MSFSAVETGSGNIRFSISAQGNFCSREIAIAFGVFGAEFEGKTWEHFLNRVAEECRQN